MKFTSPKTFIVSLALLLATLGSAALAQTYNVTESWSVTLEYTGFGDNNYYGTKHFSGTQSGSLTVNGGHYTLIDKTGVQWSDSGRGLADRTLYGAQISGDYAFAPAYGASAYGLVFLGAFAIKVPLIDGEVPAFSSIDYYSASGSDISFMSGSGYMHGSSLRADVSSTLSFTPKPPEATKPTAIITSPAAGARLTNSTIIMQGTAGDNVGVAQVEWRLENANGIGNYRSAIGTTSWSATISGLLPGINTVRVRSKDVNGNVSTEVTRSFSYVIVRFFAFSIAGNGTVTPNYNGQPLEIGKSYTMTATPGSGFIFAGWSGGITSPTAKLTFLMQSNLVLQANFIPNPFLPTAGNYAGLFFDPTNGVANQSAGFFSAIVTSAGKFSAKLLLAGKSTSIAGQFSGTGSASNSIVRSGLNPLTVLLQLNLSGQDMINGQISDGIWIADLLADRATFNLQTNPAPQFGKYTFLIPGAADSSALPGGTGFASVLVDLSGNVNLKGALGDGTKVLQKTFLSKQRQWPFYLPLYAGKGLAIGWLTFTNQPGDDISGMVNWIKVAQPLVKFYPNGFATESAAIGSKYVFTSSVPILSFSTGQVALANGNLAQNFTNRIAVSTNNLATNLSSNKLTLVFTTTSGLFKGSVVNPATGQPVLFSGAVFQKQNIGAGFFLGTNQTGHVLLNQF